MQNMADILRAVEGELKQAENNKDHLEKTKTKRNLNGIKMVNHMSCHVTHIFKHEDGLKNLEMHSSESVAEGIQLVLRSDVLWRSGATLVQYQTLSTQRKFCGSAEKPIASYNIVLSLHESTK